MKLDYCQSFPNTKLCLLKPALCLDLQKSSLGPFNSFVKLFSLGRWGHILDIVEDVDDDEEENDEERHPPRHHLHHHHDEYDENDNYTDNGQENINKNKTKTKTTTKTTTTKITSSQKLGRCASHRVRLV